MDGDVTWAANAGLPSLFPISQQYLSKQLPAQLNTNYDHRQTPDIKQKTTLDTWIPWIRHMNN